MRPRVLGLVGLVCLSVAGQPKFEKKSLREEQKATGDKPGYQVEADYPVFTAPISPIVNELSLHLLQADIERFKAEYREGLPGKNPWGYWSHGSLEYSSPKVISVLYTITARQAGAHPRFYFLAQGWSPQSGQALKLADYFKPATPWLKKLSVGCIARLKKEIHGEFGSSGDAQIERGAGPVAENFQTVLPTARGFRVYFPTNQIGPNLIRTRIVTVPYSDFAGMLAQDWSK